MTRLADYRGTRELTVNLTLRELRGKYKRSTLGWTWSLLNPLASVVIFSVVFSFFLKIAPPVGDPSGLDSFVMFLLCGLLPWNYLANGLNASMAALVDNGNLIKKVYFPREILVVANVAAHLVTLLIELGVLVIVLMLVGNMALPWIPVALGLVAIQTLLVVGFGLMLSVFNVYFRDVQHFIPIALQAWFYATPIVYPLRLVPDEATLLGVRLPLDFLYRLNPMVPLVEAYRDVFYDLRFPSAGAVGYLFAWAVGSVCLGLWVFSRLDRRLAEEV
ncbi:MAG: ABC transporter permease [Actinomycetota bacterium]